MNLDNLIEKRLAAVAAVKDSGDFISRLGQKIECAGKILICGNGGSASQASHFAAELMVRYKKERKRYFAVALGTDPAVVSAISNDYNYGDVFSMQINSVAKRGDLVVVLSTSGNSKNIIGALEESKRLGVYSVALLGKGGGIAKDLADLSCVAPTDDAAVAQEFHLTLIHLVCEYLDSRA